MADESRIIPGGGPADNVPAALRALRRWVGWRAVERDGKVTKVPVNPATSGMASSTDPATWSEFDAALGGALSSLWTGVGFVFAEGDGYVGIDLDDVIDPATGELDPDAAEVVDRFATYAEVSPSGTGVHLILKGTLPPGGRKKGDRECYDRGRFFTVTGLRASRHDAEDRQDILAAWHAETFPPPAPIPAGPVQPAAVELPDRELLDKIARSKQGEKFGRLWAGDAAGYASGSEADLALCAMLAWWTGNDAAAVDRLYRASGLMRPKWDARRGESTYGKNTVAKAVAGTQGGYDPHHKSGPLAVINTAAGPGADRPFLWASELNARPANTKWVWNGYLSRGGITLLSALWKSGKSTLLSHLVKAFGGDLPQFCGRDIAASRVLYVTEEDQETWAERRNHIGLADHAGFWCRPFLGRPNAAQWSGFLAQIAEAVGRWQFEVVIFDTISKLWPVKDENDATGVEEALMPLWTISQRGVSVLIVHHTRKAGGTEFTESRGSGGLPAFCETLVTLRRSNPNDRHDRKRVLEACGRYKETPSKWSVELAADGLSFAAHGEPGDEPGSTSRPSDRWRAVLPELLPQRPPGATRDQVNKIIAERCDGVGAAPALLLAELTTLVEAGRCQRLGTGARGSPFRYCLTWSDSDAPTSAVDEPEESEAE